MAGLLRGLAGQEGGAQQASPLPASCQVPRQGSSCRRGPPSGLQQPEVVVPGSGPLGPPWETPHGLSRLVQALKAYSTFTGSAPPSLTPALMSPSDRWGN